MPFKKGQTPWNKGRHHTVETKRKISNRLKGRLLGVSKPQSVKKKMSRSAKLSWSDEVIREKRLTKTCFKSGSQNVMWKGNVIKPISAGHRARSLYKLEPCSVCGSHESERHHRDGNRMNNSKDNIDFLCRRHHMIADGRMYDRSNGQFCGSDSRISIYYRCSCEFRTFFPDEVKVHIAETEDDTREHKIISVLVDKEVETNVQ